MRPAKLPSPSMVISCIALIVALGGTSYAALKIPKNAVGSKQIKKNAVTGAKVKDRSLFANDFASGQLPKGDPGAPGPKGDKGDPGAPATLPALEPWKPLPFAAGWADFGDGQTVAQYRKDPSGRVQLRGVVTKSSGTPGFSQAIATLPEGYRPKTAANQHFPAVTGSGSSTVVPGAVYVTPGGEIGWMTGSTTEKDYTDLSGVSFWTD